VDSVAEGAKGAEGVEGAEGARGGTDAGFTPRILVFCCNWCSYAGADLAGVARLQMPADFRVLRVMCSGRVKPEYAFKALEQGIDGVFVLGCHIGDCHYLEGNHRAKKRFEVLSDMLGHLGLEPERVKIDWVSASEGAKFQEFITRFVETIRSLGPSPLGGGRR
jgi:F420-non-reducing hydrogenase iron-sulfur subunit